MIGLILWAWRTSRRIARAPHAGWDTADGQRLLAQWVREYRASHSDD